LRGVVKYARGHGFVELREVEEAPPAPDQIKVEVRAAGICGSDLHMYHDTINYRIRTPVVMGHEFSGVVVEKGVDVGDEVEIGDRVTGEPTIALCGRCDYCLSEHYNLCSQREVIGYFQNGCFASYCNVKLLHKLPDTISFEAGALTELLACCVHAVTEQASISVGDSVVVIGPGPVGLLAALIAQAEGGRVILCGTSRDGGRLQFARELGIEHVIDVEVGDAAETVRDLAGSDGADVVVECSGAGPAVNMALDMVRKRGQLTQMGLFGRPVEVDFEKIAYKELQVSGGIGQRRPAWRRALRLMESGEVQAEKLISHDLGLDEWERGFELLEKQEGMKVILRP
jgi:L-iditol 2-dehydrogenase